MWQIFAAQAAMSLVGGIQQGKADAKALGKQAGLDEFEARGVEQEAKDTADIIMANAMGVKAAQVAQMGASGFVVGDGSAQAVIDETDKLARRDAMAAIYSGVRQAASKRAGASARMSAADDAVLTGTLKGVSGAISSYGSYKASKG